MSAITRFALVFCLAASAAVSFATGITGTWHGTVFVDRGQAHSATEGTYTREELAILRSIRVTLKLTNTGFQIKMTHMPSGMPNQTVEGTYMRNGSSIQLNEMIHNGTTLPHSMPLPAEILGNDHIIRIQLDSHPTAWFEFRK